jgi:hypothetical protein
MGWLRRYWWMFPAVLGGPLLALLMLLLVRWLRVTGPSHQLQAGS